MMFLPLRCRTFLEMSKSISQDLLTAVPAFRSTMHFFARVREDLDHIQASTFPFGRDQARLIQAKRELDQLQEMQARGRFDRRQLDDVVAALRSVVDDNRLAGRDREVLADDLTRLQDFPTHLRDYGVR